MGHRRHELRPVIVEVGKTYRFAETYLATEWGDWTITRKEGGANFAFIAKRGCEVNMIYDGSMTRIIEVNPEPDETEAFFV